MFQVVIEEVVPQSNGHGYVLVHSGGVITYVGVEGDDLSVTPEAGDTIELSSKSAGGSVHSITYKGKVIR